MKDKRGGVTRIELVTNVHASPERCFDLSRDLDLHQRSMRASKERAIAGVTSGLIELGQSVTWEARHFGVRWRMTSRITEYERPHRFVDESSEGPFAQFRHEHRFEPQRDGTRMVDIVDFALPFGAVGRLAATLVAAPYLKRLLSIRNEQIELAAEDQEYADSTSEWLSDHLKTSIVARDTGYETPEEAAVKSFPEAARARVIRVEHVTDTRVDVITDTDPPHRMRNHCERIEGLWYEVGDIVE